MSILSDHDSSSPGTFRATSSASTDPVHNRYDVFLSFRGSDTRHGFTDHLYNRLVEAGIPTFRDDDELKKGEPLKQQLEKAIKESTVSVIVFSEDYASSPWCLDEVVRILEKKKDHKVIPVFYHVDVSAVRYQKGSYGEAFDLHRRKGYVVMERIEAWKRALNEAAALSGFPLAKNADKPETEFISEIVCAVESSLPKTLDVLENLVGMNYRAHVIDSWLKDRSKDNNVLVIYGIGGIGKTTLAKYHFNEYYKDFGGSCFLASITEMWNKTGVCGLQSQLLSTILNKREEIRIYNCDEFTRRIKKAICSRKVLVVLDDVSEREQLEAFLGQKPSFYPGSKILVTTRNMSLVKNFIVDARVHKVEVLNDDDSLKLFSWHAFRQHLPLEEYMQISNEIILRCRGLPLTLVVLGSSLGKNLKIDLWEKQLQKWEEIGNPDVQKIMKVSYDSLEDDKVKDLFLHIACFFVGEEEDYVVKILDACKLHAMVGIQNLIDRCLITTHENKLLMHQVIQDMGREIVRQECPREPGRRSRLWYHEDSFNVLKYDKGSKFVQGLLLDGQKIKKPESERSSFATANANPDIITRLLGKPLPSKEGELKLDAFAKMVNLKLLKLNYVHLTGSCNKFPKELRWISWHGFPLEYIPMELSLENLVALDLQHSILKKVWKGNMVVNSLKILNLSYSLKLFQTPDFKGLLQLERLILRGCSNLYKVCKTIGVLQRLLLLDLSDCTSLIDLPGLPKSLLELYLSGCSHLGEFPVEQQNVKPSDGYKMVKYASPNISTGRVNLLAHLPHQLVKLSLKDCDLSDECFPRDFNGLSSLEMLDLGGNLITRLPDCVRNLSNSRLRHLTISSCPHLQSVIHPPTIVEHLYLENNRQLENTNTRRRSKHFYLVFDEIHTPHFEIEGFFKWVKAGNVARKIIKNLGLELVPIDIYLNKVLYEFGIFSTFVRSIGSVPPCFGTYYVIYTDGEDDYDYSGVPYLINVSVKKMDTVKLRYTIPSSSVARKIQGLNICFIKIVDEQQRYYMRIEVTVCNKTKDLAWTYCYEDRFEELGRASEDYMWVSMWKCDEDLLEAGDEIEVTFKTFDWGENLKVKQCGIRIVYEEEEEGDEDLSYRSLIWTEEMNVSFSNYHTPGTNYFLLGLLAGSLFKHEDEHITEDMDGRPVQFVGWWGANQYGRSNDEAMYVLGYSP